MSINSLLTNQPVLNTLKELIGGGGSGGSYTATLPIEISGLNDISLLTGQYLNKNVLTNALQLTVTNNGTVGQVLQCSSNIATELQFVDTVSSVGAGTNIAVDNTIPAAPVVSMPIAGTAAAGKYVGDNGGGLTWTTLPASVTSVGAGTNIAVDATIPSAPVVSMPIGGTYGTGNFVGDSGGALTWQAPIYPKTIFNFLDTSSAPTTVPVTGALVSYQTVSFTPTVTGFAYASAILNCAATGSVGATIQTQIYYGSTPVGQASRTQFPDTLVNIAVGSAVPTVALTPITIGVYASLPFASGVVGVVNGYLNVTYDLQ